MSAWHTDARHPFVVMAAYRIVKELAYQVQHINLTLKKE